MKKIVIIGGGASGLASAMTLNEMKKIYDLDVSITLLEASEKLGRKILASGNGRCNLSHQNIIPTDYQHQDPFDLMPVLSSFDPHHFFEEHGLWIKNEGELIYPSSKQASSVVAFFEEYLDGVQISFLQKVKRIDPTLQFVETSSNQFDYDYLIIACGSKAANSLGGNESGYEMLKGIGISSTPLYPALVQMKTKQVKKYLKGTRLRGTFSLIRNKQMIHFEKGELLFTDYGLSGIAIFQLSRYYLPGDEIEMDLFDDLSEKQLSEKLKEGMNCGHFQLELILPKAFGRFLHEKYEELQFSSIRSLVQDLKHYRFKIDGLHDFEHAQITSGGIALKEMNSNLSLIKYPEIYLCGEILDVDGPCGGYNLHFAFSSGHFVANQIIQKIMEVEYE